MKCDNCDNPATMHKHYEKSDGTFADSRLCDKCFDNSYMYNSFDHNTCVWCGKKFSDKDGFLFDKQMRKYCSPECAKRFMGYEDE